VDPPLREPIQVGKWIPAFWRALGYRPRGVVPGSVRFKSYHFTTKAGPNGHALGHYLDDAEALPDTLINHIGVVAGDKLKDRIILLRQERDVIRGAGHLPPPPTSLAIRKLVAIDDMEGKKRVIAELDYFSQAALKPLHAYLFRVLKKIPQDRTFSQSGFVRGFDGLDCEIISADLTAATDRFPISVIAQILEGVLPPEYVQSWKEIMVGYPFRYRNGQVSYSVGNPMGAYSSWASFAVAHHYLVFYCCMELGIDWRTYRYHLLGDDIVLTDSRVGDLYITLLSGLGVEVSPQKTHRSSRFFEFAKRLFYSGGLTNFREITPFPISALGQMSRRSYLLTCLLMEVECKGWETGSIPMAVQEYYEWVLGHRYKSCIKARDTSVVSEQITRVIRGSITAQSGVYTILRHFGLRIAPWNCRDFLSSIVVEMFADSNPEDCESGDLGGLAVHLVIHYTGHEWSPPVTASSVIEADPILFSYGRVEVQYLDLRREARKIDTVGKGDWPLILRSFALPRDDKIFVMRSHDVQSLCAYVIGKKALDRLRSVPVEWWKPFDPLADPSLVDTEE
jgi:hypothetical protein